MSDAPKPESRVQSEIRLAAPGLGVTLWRNNSGACNDETGRMIRYGLGNDSAIINRRIKSSDLIGIRQRDGKFVAVECKEEGWTFPRKWWSSATPPYTCTLAPLPLHADAIDEETATNADLRRTLAQWRFICAVRDRAGIGGFCTSVEEFRKLVGC